MLLSTGFSGYHQWLSCNMRVKCSRIESGGVGKESTCYYDLHLEFSLECRKRMSQLLAV